MSFSKSSEVSSQMTICMTDQLSGPSGSTTSSSASGLPLQEGFGRQGGVGRQFFSGLGQTLRRGIGFLGSFRVDGFEFRVGGLWSRVCG